MSLTTYERENSVCVGLCLHLQRDLDFNVSTTDFNRVLYHQIYIKQITVIEGSRSKLSFQFLLFQILAEAYLILHLT